MTRIIQYILLGALILLSFSRVNAQSGQAGQALINKMGQHENDILLMYLEYQKLYYEDKSRRSELRAFEHLLSVYIDQVTEIYETLKLGDKKSIKPRDIAARTLIFKALMLLEKAPLNQQYFEKACYEYYEALNIYEDTDVLPVVYKDLPRPILAGTKSYYRMKDILDDKGSGLKSFGKVNITFRNFMVTADFDPENLELSRLPGNGHDSNSGLTFELAEKRIKDSFAEVFRKNVEVHTYVALPAGAYVLRLHGSSKSSYIALTQFYVSENQQQHYIMEPLADWIILYENPMVKRPDFYKYQRMQSTYVGNGLETNLGLEPGSNGAAETNEFSSSISHEILVAEIIKDLLPNYEIKMMFDLNDPDVRESTSEIMAKTIVEYLNSPQYYRSWSHWTSSWIICQKVREIISPGSLIPVDLMKLVYKVISEL